MQTAQHRITIGALYLGTAPGLESDFLDMLSTVASSPSHSNVKITMVCDQLRATRMSHNRDGRPSSTSKEVASHLLQTQQELKTDYIPATMALYHTPALRGILKRCALV